MAGLTIVEIIGCVQHRDVRIDDGLHLVPGVRAVDGSHALERGGESLGVVYVYSDMAILVCFQVGNVPVPGARSGSRRASSGDKQRHVLADMQADSDVRECTGSARYYHRV